MILIKNYLDKEFCKGIIKYGEEQTLEPASVGDNDSFIVNKEVRRSHTHFITAPIYNSPFIQDLYFNLNWKVAEINANVYGFQLYTSEAFQFTKYEAEDEGFYDWHMDCLNNNPKSERKLSFSLLLNDSSDFEGGDLKFQAEGVDELKQAGDLLIFPSFEQHRVEPVTKGTRYSLVGWYRGPHMT